MSAELANLDRESEFAIKLMRLSKEYEDIGDKRIGMLASEIHIISNKHGEKE